MAVLGTWVTEQIKQSVLETSGAQGAQFMAGFLEPHVQGLQSGQDLSDEAHRTLDGLFIGTPVGDSVISIKIWRADGTVIYSTNKGLIGQKFVSSDVERASRGEIIAEYEDLVSQESAYEQALNVALIEVYGPLYLRGTDQVLAVGEIYENADALAAELELSQLRTWLVVCLTTVLMLAVLYFIVRRGDMTIVAQRSELRQHVQDARQLARQNDELRLAADKARLDASEANEQLLDRIGSDLHDGPIQLLTLLTLKLSDRSISKQVKTLPDALKPLVASLRNIAGEAITELRNLSSGLSLPEISGLTLEEALRSAVSHHEDITGDRVAVVLRNLPAHITEATKICGYRVIQEGLNNAYKHAKESQKSVEAFAEKGFLMIEVRDSGAKSDTPVVGVGRQKMGLTAMRNRVGALKGNVSVTTDPVEGTVVVAKLPLDAS
ncbi:MAG: histidine kinase [Devosia sp.]